MADKKAYVPMKSEVFQRQGSSNWYIRYPTLQDDGSTTKIRKGGFETREEAVKEFLERKNAYEEQKANEYVERRDMPFAKYLENFFNNVWSAHLRNATKVTYENTLEYYIKPNLDQELMLSKVTRSYLEFLFKTIGKGEHPSFAKKSRELIHKCLSVAVEDRLISNNPCSKAKAPFYDEKDIVILRKHQYQPFFQSIQQTNLFLEFLLAILLGLRKGEIYGLKFCDFDFSKSTVHIQRQVKNEYVFDAELNRQAFEQTEGLLKTPNSERVLHVHPFIKLEVLRRKKRVDTQKSMYGTLYEDHDYVCGQDDGSPRAGSCLNKALNDITDKLDYPRMAFHFLRHTSATLLFRQGADYATVANILGHASIETTKRIYIDVEDELFEIANVIDRKLGHLATSRAQGVALR